MNVCTQQDIINELDPNYVRCTKEDCGQWLKIDRLKNENNMCPSCNRSYVSTNPLTWMQSVLNQKGSFPTFITTMETMGRWKENHGG